MLEDSSAGNVSDDDEEGAGYARWFLSPLLKLDETEELGIA